MKTSSRTAVAWRSSAPSSRGAPSERRALLLPTARPVPTTSRLPAPSRRVPSPQVSPARTSPPVRRSSLQSLRALGLALLALAAFTLGSPRPLAAAPHPASIEIDARAEALIEPRAVRRLVQLELADVDVRPAPGQRDTVLFVRVLGAGEGQLRIELWERGVAY